MKSFSFLNNGKISTDNRIYYLGSYCRSLPEFSVVHIQLDTPTTVHCLIPLYFLTRQLQPVSFHHLHSATIPIFGVLCVMGMFPELINSATKWCGWTGRELLAFDYRTLHWVDFSVCVWWALVLPEARCNMGTDICLNSSPKLLATSIQINTKARAPDELSLLKRDPVISDF